MKPLIAKQPDIVRQLIKRTEPFIKKLEAMRVFRIKPSSIGKVLLRTGMYIFLLDVAFVFLFPFLYMIVTSFKSYNDLMDITVNWIPTSLHWKNYQIAADLLSYWSHFISSVFITSTSTIGHLLSCSLAGYGFARYKFPGKNLCFSIVIMSIIVPIQTIIIPLYMRYVNMGWIDSHLPLIVPTFFGYGLRGGLFIFLFRQFFLGLPSELEDAAKIDGCGFIRTYWSIILPIAKSAILVSCILSMVWHWHDYYEPVLYIHSSKYWPLPIMLPSMYQSLTAALILVENVDEILVTEGVVMAATFIVVFPVLIIYLFLQKRFIQGIERTGITG